MAAAEQDEGNMNAATWELVPMSERQEPERFLSGTPLVPGYSVKAPVPPLPPKRLAFRSRTKVLCSFPAHSGPHCPRWFLVILRSGLAVVHRRTVNTPQLLFQTGFDL